MESLFAYGRMEMGQRQVWNKGQQESKMEGVLCWTEWNDCTNDRVGEYVHRKANSNKPNQERRNEQMRMEYEMKDMDICSE
jgi:hypothetical protein